MKVVGKDNKGLIPSLQTSEKTEELITEKKEVLSITDLPDKELLAAFLGDKEQMKVAGQQALTLQEEFPNWFTVPRVSKKFKISIDKASKLIEMLMLFKVCVGKVEKKIPYFRVDMDGRVQRELIIAQIAEHEGKILFLKEKLSLLN